MMGGGGVRKSIMVDGKRGNHCFGEQRTTRHNAVLGRVTATKPPRLLRRSIGTEASTSPRQTRSTALHVGGREAALTTLCITLD